MNALALVRPLAASVYRIQKAKTSAFSRNHDVFLRFRGPDHRTGFVGFLYEGLVAAGHRVFGDEAYGLQQKGKASAFSWSYYDVFLSCRGGDAGSPFADFLYKSLVAVGLRELAEIMDSHGEHGKSVSPVFYKLGVDDLSRRRRKLGEALCGQQCRGEEVAALAEALRSLTRIRGWMSPQAIADGREEERTAKTAVAKVSSELLVTRWSSTFMRLVDLYFWEKKRRESEKRRRECQVLLAFRGLDTRYNLAAYLHTSLVAEGIRVFDGGDISVVEELDEKVVDLGCQRGNFEEAPREREMQCRRGEAREWVEALWSRIRGWMSQVIPNGVRGRKESNYMPNSSTARHERQVADIVAARVLSESSDQGKKRREYQVFLTFGGPDARYNLAGSLYISLLAEGIKVLTNDDLIGENGHQIRNAIDQCKISIPILSKNFAYSHWCLKELAHMVECKRTKGQKILPIFYKVEPSHVRDISHSFGEHMLRYKELADEGRYEWCERAIRELGYFEGWVSEKITNGVLVNKVVKEVVRLLNIH